MSKSASGSSPDKQVMSDAIQNQEESARKDKTTSNPPGVEEEKVSIGFRIPPGHMNLEGVEPRVRRQNHGNQINHREERRSRSAPPAQPQARQVDQGPEQQPIVLVNGRDAPLFHEDPRNRDRDSSSGIDTDSEHSDEAVDEESETDEEEIEGGLRNVPRMLRRELMRRLNELESDSDDDSQFGRD